MTAEEGDDGGTKGGRAANIIINQRSCDVNVKLPEPIWSCITRGGWKGTSWRTARRVTSGSGGGQWAIVRVICHAAYRSTERERELTIREGWSFLLADYRWLLPVLSAICKERGFLERMTNHPFATSSLSTLPLFIYVFLSSFQILFDFGYLYPILIAYKSKW